MEFEKNAGQRDERNPTTMIRRDRGPTGAGGSAARWRSARRLPSEAAPLIPRAWL